jgi:hypothetical protein
MVIKRLHKSPLTAFHPASKLNKICLFQEHSVWLISNWFVIDLLLAAIRKTEEKN